MREIKFFRRPADYYGQPEKYFMYTFNEHGLVFKCYRLMRGRPEPDSMFTQRWHKSGSYSMQSMLDAYPTYREISKAEFRDGARALGYKITCRDFK